MRRRAFVGLLVVVGGAACGDVRLVEPQGGTVTAAGARFSVEVREDGAAQRMSFRGYFYGYENRGGRALLRYLDAGTVRVAGFEATRGRGAGGELEYTLEVGAASIGDRVRVTVEGGGEVARCTAEVPLPLALLGRSAIRLAEGEGLRIPLSFAPGWPAGQRIGVAVRITGGRETGVPVVVTFETVSTGADLAVPASVVAAVPPGVVTLDVTLRWEADVARSSTCAPVVAVEAKSHVRRVGRRE